MKLLRLFPIHMLFVVCGCTYTATMEEFERTVYRHNDETINNVWYMGSEEDYDFFRHNTMLSSRTYRIHDAIANASTRFALTTDRRNWLLVKDNGSLILNRTKANRYNVASPVIIFTNECDRGKCKHECPVSAFGDKVK